MKLRGIFLLLFAFILTCGCERQPQQEIDMPFSFYYLNAQETYESKDGLICAEIVSLDAQNMSLEDVLLRYLEGPITQDLTAAVPESWELESCYIENETAVLVFSQPLDAQSEIDRSLANACLAKTVFQIEGIERISITNDSSNQSVILTKADIQLEDTGEQMQQEEILIYFADENRRYLVPETHYVTAGMDQPQYILQQLLTAKRGDELRSCIPAGTTLLDITVENGVCTVNLSSEFAQNMEERFAIERIAVYSIVNSLTELDEIKNVELLVAGAPLERLYFMTLDTLERNEEMIVKGALEDRLDVTMYYTVENSDLLVALPYMLLLTPELTTAESFINALISYEAGNGIENTIAEGTKVLSLKIENNLCVVDFTREFLDGCANEQEEIRAVRSVIATLTTLDEIDSVELLVEGLEPSYRKEGLSALRRPISSWFAE